MTLVITSARPVSVMKYVAAFPARLVHYIVYARHGRELMECKSPVREPRRIHHRWILAKVRAEGKGVSARRGPKEARWQTCEPTDRNRIQGLAPGRVGTTQQSPQVQGAG